jgi:hypothetical protein
MPTPDEVRVATNLLRTTASKPWEEQSARITTVPATVRETKFGYIQAGVFALVVPHFDSVTSFVADRCTEGTDRLAAVARILRHVADVYETEDGTTGGQISEHAKHRLW